MNDQLRVRLASSDGQFRDFRSATSNPLEHEATTRICFPRRSEKDTADRGQGCAETRQERISKGVEQPSKQWWSRRRFESRNDGRKGMRCHEKPFHSTMIPYIAFRRLLNCQTVSAQASPTHQAPLEARLKKTPRLTCSRCMFFAKVTDTVGHCKKC
jgi:hypothetical protein